jgi:glycosyltransferase involved in cell wall biosynthesis
VIVIDDGSDDGSLAIVRSFGDAVQFESTKNQGAAAARNLGIKLARGELVQFLDADDLLHPAKLERMLPLALQDCGSMVFSNCLVVDMASGQRLGTWGRKLLPGMDPVVYAFSATLQTAAPLHVRENLTRVGGFRPEMPPCDDPDLHFRLAVSGLRFRQLPEQLVTVRRMDGSLSKRDPTHGIRMEQKLGLDAVKELKRIDALNDQRAQAIAGFLASAGRRAIRIGDSGLAATLFCQATQVHPSGGIPQAYCSRTQLVRSLVGPVLTERLVGWKRRLLRERAIG